MARSRTDKLEERLHQLIDELKEPKNDGLFFVRFQEYMHGVQELPRIKQDFYNHQSRYFII